MYDLCLRTYVGNVDNDNDDTYAFAEVSQLYPNVTDEIVSGPYLHDHDCFQVYRGYEEICENKTRREWVTTSLCKHPRQSFPKYSTLDISVLGFIWEGIIVLDLSTQTVLTRVSSVMYGYYSSLDKYPPKCAPSRGVWLFTTVSQYSPCSHYSVSRTLRRPFRPGVWGHFYVWSPGSSCKMSHPLSTNCMCVLLLL